jgi:threonyl-tRNA synthetase
MACPELYESFRNESCIEELNGEHFTILKYSKGRNEFRFGDVTEVEIPNVMKLTLWKNGDYKLIYNEQVYFWHEEEKCLDKYCVTI